MVALLILCVLTALWSAIAGPIVVARRNAAADAAFTLSLYIARAVPLGLAVAVLATFAIFGGPAPGLAVLLIVSAVVQAADSVIGFARRDAALGAGAAAFAVVQAVTGALLF